ncbi:MAG: host-nuclease inhibitor Gam family protein [Bacteroidota bacterium]
MAKVKQAAAEEAADELRQALNEKAILKAKMNEEISNISADYDAELRELTKTIESRQTIVGNYVAQNRESMLGDKKSTAWQGLSLGFKKNPDKLVIFEDSWYWEDVTQKLIDNGHEELVDTQTSVNKSALKKRLLEAGDDDDLGDQLGVEVQQTETFFVKLKS